MDSVTFNDSQALEFASFVNGVLLWTEGGISETKILSLCQTTEFFDLKDATCKPCAQNGYGTAGIG